MARFWSSQTWVMPTFSPTIALVATAGTRFPLVTVLGGAADEATVNPWQHPQVP
jgi:hypothetical protein